MNDLSKQFLVLRVNSCENVYGKWNFRVECVDKFTVAICILVRVSSKNKKKEECQELKYI